MSWDLDVIIDKCSLLVLDESDKPCVNGAQEGLLVNRGLDQQSCAGHEFESCAISKYLHKCSPLVFQ